MDIFDMEFPELPSIAPDLMFGEEPAVDAPTTAASTVETPTILTPTDREALLSFVLDDHAYAKPYPILTTANNKCLTPQTVLTLHPSDSTNKKELKRNESKFQSPGSEDDDEIDVVGVDEPTDYVVKYDKTKAHNGMNEVESYLNSLWKDVTKDDDEKITRGSWSKEQARLFDVVYKLITNYQLAKLTYVKNDNEPVLRKLALDKATHRIRKAFGTVLWNPKYIVWLHGVMLDGLGSSLFLCYLEILQSLKRKAPILFERVLLFDRTASEKEMTAGLPNLGVRLKKSWDPSTGLQSKVTVEKFPTTPFLIMVPSGPNIPHQSTKRNRFWNNQLMNFSKVFPINVPAYRTLEGYVIKHYLEHCISAIRSKITEFRNRFPERHVVLVGWGVGSLISLKVANLYKVDAIICLGFPCNGIDGDASDEYWKGLTKIECPILFVLGTHATSNSIHATERLREQMKTQTNLMLIESADEMLRLTNSQKKALGMTQNMIDKLIQDQIYLFLKGVLFKPKPVIATTTKGPVSGKKRKKKIDSAEKSLAVETSKKKKKSSSKSALQQESNKSGALLPLDVSISSVSSVPLLGTQGLLTTGSVSTSIPVTQLQSESLTNIASNSIQQPTITPADVVISTSKENVKRNTWKEPKEKVKRSKSNKKMSKNMSANLMEGSTKKSAIASHTTKTSAQVAFQRVPTGSFVLSGASGQIRLQGGANILYLQQASSGATQLLNTPAINASSGAFTAVISSNIVSNPPKINIVPSSNFKLGSLTSTTAGQPTKGLSAVISSGGCGNLVINSTTLSNNVNTTTVVDTPNKNVEVSTSSLPTTSISISPPKLTSSASVTPVTSTASSTIMTHLSANDLRYLASLIAKHSNSRPNSPMPSSISGPLVLKSDDKTILKTTRDSSDTQKVTGSSTTSPDVASNLKKSSLISILDKKGSTINNPISSSKKIVQPPSLAQRVASIQQKEASAKIKAQRLKTSKLISTTVNMPMGHIITANSTKSSTTMPPTSKTVPSKTPVTLTIPISRLPSSINFSSTSALSKSIINVPVLSSYLTQEKLSASTAKPSPGLPSSARAIVTSSSTQAKKSPVMMSGGNVCVCSGQVRLSNISALSSSRSSSDTLTSSSSRSNSGNIFISKAPFTTTMSSFKSPMKGRTASPISLQLPSHGSLKDPKVLRKAVSDVKVVGVLSQHQSKAQFPSLVSLSTLRSMSNPSSPLRSPTNEEEIDEPSRELKSSDDRKIDSSMKSSIMAAIGERSLSPSTASSTSLLTASSLRDMNFIGRSGITGKVSSGPFFGKLFVGPKSIVDPARGKVTLSTDPNATIGVNSFGKNIDCEPYDEDEDDIDEDYDDEDESDVDFAISSPGRFDSPIKSSSVQKNVEPVKHTNITKIVYAPNTSGEIKTTNCVNTVSTFPKNALDIARAKVHDSSTRSSETSIVTDPKARLEEHSTSSSILGSEAKLRFEPLKVPNSRTKFTSVLSMKDSSDESSFIANKSNRQIIISTTSKHFTSLASSTCGPISNITISQDSICTQLEKDNQKIDTIRKPAKTNGTFYELSGGNGLSPKSERTFSEINDSKDMVLENIESRKGAVIDTIASSNRVVSKVSSPSYLEEARGLSSTIEPREHSKTHKLPLKSAKHAQQQDYNVIVEEDPQPYITRSGRVMRSKYSIQYIDELDRKKTPKKRRLSSSSNPDNSPSNKRNKAATSDVTPPTSAVTLENLVEAAKLITKESDTVVDNKNVIESVMNHSNIDSTTNIAATAMLELISCDNLSTDKSNNAIDPQQDFNSEFSSNGLSHHGNITIDPRLPSLAPILKVSSEIPNMSNDNEDVVDENVLTESELERASLSPIPPLAAIQDKCTEKDISMELVDSKNRLETPDDNSRTKNNPEINTLPSKQIVSCSPLNECKQPEGQQLTEGLPILAVIQDKPESTTLKEQSRVVSPLTVISSEKPSAEVPEKDAPRNPSQTQNSNMEFSPEKRCKTRRSPSPRSPSSSPPALAVIQNNSLSIPAPNFNDSNLVLGDNCTVTLTDIALASSLPPLVAIQVNVNEKENCQETSSTGTINEQLLPLPTDANSCATSVEQD